MRGIVKQTAEKQMKITNVEAIYVRMPAVKEQTDSGQDALLVKVDTDAGITGLGEVDSAPLAVKQVIEGPYSHTLVTGLRNLLLGEDPFQTEYLWNKMYQSNIYAGRRGIGIHAMTGIDIALWDIKGKALGLPVWKLLGGDSIQKFVAMQARCLVRLLPKQVTSLDGSWIRDLRR